MTSLVKSTLAVPAPSDSVWITDTDHGRLHRIAPDGSLSVILPDLGGRAKPARGGSADPDETGPNQDSDSPMG